MKITELARLVRPPFAEIFPTPPMVLDAVTEAMRTWGYDNSQPVIVWDEGQVVIDGHTRIKAAQEAGITDIPVHYKSFATEDEALAYAIHLQRNRRNLTDAEIVRCIEALDRRKQRGASDGFRGNQYVKPEVVKAPNGAISKSSQETAKVVGISPRKVERTRTILEHAEEPVKKAVRAGEMSINRAYQLTQEKRRTQENGRAVFNRTNESIEWAVWTWNPVTGCKHGCPYCYARDIARRFYPPEIGFNPHFWPERLSAPQNTPVPKSTELKDHLVFTCSMADLFGAWVPQEWIDQVLKAVREAPQWIFLFLTKNPKRYLEIEFPPNAWVGATADTQVRADEALKVFRVLHQGKAKVPRPKVLFLSLEPLREEIDLSPGIEVLDWLIIGGQSESSGEPARQPEWGWVEQILWRARETGKPVFFKPNLTIQPREYPERSQD
jgi:protein gp37